MENSEAAVRSAEPQPEAAVAPRADSAAAQAVPAAEADTGGALRTFRRCLPAEVYWWGASFVFHALLMCIILLLLPAVVTEELGNARTIESADANLAEAAPAPLEHFEVGETPLDPTELTTETLSLDQAPNPNDPEGDSGGFLSSENVGGGMPTALSNQPSLGGLGTGFDVASLASGVSARGSGGIGVGVGTGVNPGSGGSGFGFSGRSDSGRKAGLGGYGGTKRSERAVGAALNWLARHQTSMGSWSLHDYPKLCSDKTCTGPGDFRSDPGATALALLPFLAAGQTHQTKGRYKNTVYKGLYWLMSNQKPDGDLASGVPMKMYSHGLASIALCEAYGLTKDRVIGQRAQQALNFIVAEQHPEGGWRYVHGQPGDTSVTGWQIMALKSGQMSGLKVDSACLERARSFLKSVSKGNYGGQYAYLPQQSVTSSMTAVGLLCRQYMGAQPDDLMMQEGVQAIMRNLPELTSRNLYYWYYATQVMHNIAGQDWDRWNRTTRKLLIETQCKEGCAAGSWDPYRLEQDRLAEEGGRIYVTSLACLSLEIYYRYLPLYKLDAHDAAKPTKAETRTNQK